jgi:hypothetical protein
MNPQAPIICRKCGLHHLPVALRREKPNCGYTIAFRTHGGLPTSAVTCECGKVITMIMRFITRETAFSEAWIGRDTR